MDDKTRWQHAYDHQPQPESLEGGIRQFNGYRHPRSYALLQKSLHAATQTWRDALILDAGSGSGDTNAFLKKDKNRMVALDFSSQMARYARQRHHERVTVGDVERLPFAANHFDALIATGVWQCLGAESPFLSEAARVVRPGGEVVLGWALNRDFIPYRRGVHFRLDPAVELRLLDAEDIPAMLRAAGLKLLAIHVVIFPLGVVRVQQVPLWLRWISPAFTLRCGVRWRT